MTGNQTIRSRQQAVEGGSAAFAPTSLFAREELLDHAKRPRNRGELPDADAAQEEVNSLCGDVVTVYVRFEGRGKIIERMTFTGHGCIISQAAASMLTEHTVGKSVGEIQRMERAEMEALLGGAFSPSRVKCALLPLVALKRGITDFPAVPNVKAQSPSQIQNPKTKEDAGRSVFGF